MVFPTVRPLKRIHHAPSEQKAIILLLTPSYQHHPSQGCGMQSHISHAVCDLATGTRATR